MSPPQPNPGGSPKHTIQDHARGDNANVNLRGIGIGSTLVLLNGRRLAPHPITALCNYSDTATYAVLRRVGSDRKPDARPGKEAICTRSFTARATCSHSASS